MAAAETKNQKFDFYFFHCKLHRKLVPTFTQSPSPRGYF